MISSLGEMYYNSIDRASSLNQYDHVVLLVLSRSRTVSLNPRGAPTETRATRKVRVRDRKSAHTRLLRIRKWKRAASVPEGIL